MDECWSSRSTWEAAVARRLMSRGLCVIALGLPPLLRPCGFNVDGVLLEYGENELGGETLGEPTLDVGAECEMIGFGGGIIGADMACSWA